MNKMEQQTARLCAVTSQRGLVKCNRPAVKIKSYEKLESKVGLTHFHLIVE